MTAPRLVSGRDARDYVEFIIEVHDSGEKVTYTSNPNAVANFFGANPNAPNFLTQIHFQKGVLDKYYQKPSTYTVNSGVLHCGHEWGLPMDNNHDDKVCAWLGDLGRIPYDEQLHWRAYNIPPRGELSETFYNNQILAVPTDGTRSEYLFRKSYENLRRVSEKHLGWPLLIPLGAEDRHHLKTLRIPSSDEQREFDELVLSLTKTIVDSLNEKKLREVISDDSVADAGTGIRLLEVVLKQLDEQHHAGHILYLRTLQSLRSTGVAHRKGKAYERALRKVGMEGQDRQVMFSDLLKQATDFLDYAACTIEDNCVKFDYHSS